jgi:LmbE family N-acetylglucosaminyl deacetylase
VTDPIALPGAGAAAVLVFAPHPDDDAIGCGGTLAMLAGEGARCTVAYMTDGSRSHPHSPRFTPAQLARLREAEARSALRALGVEASPIFMRLTDGSLGAMEPDARERVVRRTAEIVAAIDPVAVFAPWRRDVHDDHVATSAIVEEALARLLVRPALLLYPVWQPLRGRPDDAPRRGEVRVARIRLSNDARRKKQRAIAAHRSQTSDVAEDPGGFQISRAQLEAWTGPVEIFYRPVPNAPADAGARLRRAWRFVRSLA